MKRLKTILLLSLLNFCVLTTFASHYIGETIVFEDGTSGVVFYIGDDGKSGWVVDPKPVGGVRVRYSARENTDTPVPNCLTVMDALRDTAGYRNTKLIRSVGDANEYPAAYAVDFKNGWYLPAAGQVIKILANSSLLNLESLEFDSYIMPSSTEHSAGLHWIMFVSEILSPQSTRNSLGVYQVRNFSDEEFDETISYEWNTGSTSRVLVEEAKKTFTYEVTATNNYGCQAKAEKTIVVNTSTPTVIKDTICEGYTYEKFGFSATRSGTYKKTLKGENGECDVTTTLQLVVMPNKKTNLTDKVCQGEYYNKNGFAIKATAAGVYKDTAYLNTAFGCDSTVTLALNVLPLTRDTVRDRICQTEEYGRHGFDLPAGLSCGLNYYSVETTGSNGCKHTTVLALTVDTTYQVGIMDSVGMGEPYKKYGFNLPSQTTSDVHELSLKTAAGCDSLVRLTLNVLGPLDTTIVDSICRGEEYLFGGKKLTEADTYVDELKSVTGRDSIVTLELVVLDTFHVSVYDTICNGEQYIFGGKTYKKSGKYVDELKTIHGCDSIVTLHLTVNDTFHVSVYDTICNGDEYIFGGKPYTKAGSYVDELKTIYGCDSIVTLYLTVHDTFHITVHDTICDGEEYIFGGKPYTVAGTYVDELKTIHGCDSIVTLHLTVNDTFHVTVKDTICNGETYRFGIHSYTEAGTYVDELKTIHGCDSIVTLHLTVHDTSHVSVYDTICNGDEYIFGGKPYTKAGSYVDELKTIHGCDSIVTLYLTVHDTFHITVYDTICDGEEYIFGGKPYTVAGTYVDELKTIHGCDSIVTLHLTVNDTFHVTVKDTICNGETYRFGIHSYTEAGTYVDELKTIHGCDSIVTLHLTVHDTFHVSVYDTICNGDEYIFGGKPYTKAGSYVDELKTIYGCDSIVTLYLTVHDTFHITVHDTICDGEEYIFGGKPYTVAGTYVDELKTIHGCDSIVTLHLTVNDTFHVTVKDTICNGETYRFGIHSYTEAGTYVDELKTIHGCDSIVTLHLTVHDTFHVSVYDTICNGDEYIFGGKPYTKAGSYVDELKTIYGCDSIVTLYLTVHDTFHITVHDTICDGEEYIFGGKPYTVAGTYVDELKSIHGCDSIVTLQLVVHETKDTYLIDTVKVNEHFTRHGFNLTHKDVGDYTHELMMQTIYGCDSLLHLSLHVFTYDTLFVDPCPDHYVEWRGNSYIGDGYYTDETTLKDDTIHMLRIDTRAKFGLEEQVSVEICEGETAVFKPNCCETLHYSWKPATYLSSDAESTPRMKGVEDISYKVIVTDEVCEDSFTVDVTVLANPRIDTVYYDNEFKRLTMEVSGGTPGYQYFWRTEPWQLENTYSTKFSPAPMLVKVMDSKGCQSDSVVSLAVQIKPAELMTPNGDGVNDLWVVENLNYYNYYTVSIYDRFGKLLVEIDNEFEGWDGTYNGLPLPSTDYWYVIYVGEIKRTFKGHFSLIRK
ncbi:MAG: T9SS type B sorting domain-containing protein [Paludibacteraceae bacterium]|nr:T9SS type B sorting domain-containing protein [Paludibacteraceae bacterium]